MKRKDKDLGVLPDISLDPSQRFSLWLQNHGPFVCQMLLPGGPVEVNKAPCPLIYPPGSISRLLRGDRHLQLVVTAGHQKACPPPSAPHTEESPPANPPPPHTHFVPPSLLCPWMRQAASELASLPSSNSFSCSLLWYLQTQIPSINVSC